MTPLTKLWSASLAVEPKHGEAFAAALDDGAVALSTLLRSRGKTAKIEALYATPPDRAALSARIAIVAALRKTRAPKLTVKEIPNLDWLEEVATDFPPLPIARWVIHGARHKFAVFNPRRALQIDATSAFGSGEHPTTHGCLLMLNGHLKKNSVRHMLDVGTGSGILAMACVKAKPGRAFGVDIDPSSVALAKTNVARNGLGNRVLIARGNGYRARLAQRNAPYDLIMCNIFARPLARMAKDLKRHLRPGGAAILAGFLTPQTNMVLAAHRMQRIYLMQRLKIGEWTILALKRPLKAL